MTVRATSRWIVLGCLFLIPFIVLLVTNSLFFPFIAGKGFAFRIIVEIALVAWVVLALVEPKYRPQFSWTLVLYGGLVVWMFIADAFAVSPLKAYWSNFERMDGWVTLVHVFAFFVIAGAVLTKDKLWRQWWLTLIGASALVTIYAMFQYFGVFQIHQGGGRLDATLGNSAYLAVYLLFTIAASLWQALESRGWLRWCLYVLAALQALAVFFTETRGAILGAAGAVILGVLLWLFESGKEGKKKAGILLAVILILVGGLYLARDTSFVKHQPTLARLTSISLSASDTHARLAIWHMAFQGFAARPVTGWGQEGFNYIFNTYYDPSLYAQEPWFDRAHNTFLDWLTSGGLPALLLFVALLVSAVVAFYRKGVTRGERVMLVAAVAAYAFQALFVFDNLWSYIPLAALLALAGAATARPIPSLERLPALSETTAATVATPIALIVGGLIIWFVNVPNIVVAHDLIRALSPGDANSNITAFKDAEAEHTFAHQEIREQLANFAVAVAGQPGVSADTAKTFTSYAITQMNEEVKERPKDARILLESALTYRAVGDWKDATTALSGALALSPKKQQILIERALTLWQTGDVAGAAADFQTAYAISPEFDDLAIYQASADILSGKVATGQALLTQRFGTTTVDNDVLVYAYYTAKLPNEIVPILEARLLRTGTADAGFRLATAYVLAGRITDARVTITNTIRAHPEAAATGQQLLNQLSQIK